MDINIDDVQMERVIYTVQDQVRITVGYLKNQPDYKVVVKQLFCADTYALNQAVQEAYAMSKIEHSDIVGILGTHYESAQHESSIMLIMEYFERGDLQSEIQRRAASREFWTTEELWYYFGKLVSVFAFLQRQHVVHRDIKPQNIFVTNDLQLKVGDLGCATSTKLNELDKSVIGTLVYMSPEMRQAYLVANLGGRQTNSLDQCRSDVFSLGLVFLYMATLLSPMDLTNLGTLEASLQQRIAPVADPKIRRLLGDMLQFFPKDRLTFADIEIKYMSPQATVPPQPVYAEPEPQLPALTQDHVNEINNNFSRGNIEYLLQFEPALQQALRVAVYYPGTLAKSIYSELAGMYSNQPQQVQALVQILEYKNGQLGQCDRCQSVCIMRSCGHGLVCITCGKYNTFEKSCLVCCHPRGLCGYCEIHKQRIPRASDNTECVSCENPLCHTCMGKRHAGFACSPGEAGIFILPGEQQKAHRVHGTETLLQGQAGKLYCLVCGQQTHQEHLGCLSDYRSPK